MARIIVSYKYVTSDLINIIFLMGTFLVLKCLYWCKVYFDWNLTILPKRYEIKFVPSHTFQ